MGEVLIFYLGQDYISGTLFDSSGNEKMVIEKNINMIMDEEIIEHNPEDWYTSVIEIFNDIQSASEDIKIESISITYEPGTFVCIDRSGSPVLNAILPCDRRAKYQVHICEKGSRKHSDNPCIPWKHMTLPKLLWIKYNKPDAFRNIFKVLTPDGYISYRMSGEAAIDNYSAVLLGYNLNTGSYNKKLINSLGLDSSIFPQVKRAGECAGIISGNVVEELKLKSEVRILVSSNYLVPSLLAAASGDECNAVYDTESSNLCFKDSRGKVRNEGTVIRFPVKGMNAYGIIGNNEILFLKWLSRMIPDGSRGNKAFSPGSNGVIVLPYIMGDSSLYRSDIKGSIIGISNNDPYDIVTASYEAIGYIINERLEYISDHEIQINSLEIFSPIKDRLFYQIVSDIIGKKILVGSSLRNIKRCVFDMITKTDVDERFEGDSIDPDEENHLRYIKLMGLYKNAYESLDNLFRNRRKIIKNI